MEQVKFFHFYFFLFFFLGYILGMVQPGMNPQMQMMQQPGMARMNAAGMSDPQLILNKAVEGLGTI